MNAAATQTPDRRRATIFTATPQTPSQSARSLYTFPLYCLTRVDAINTCRCIRRCVTSFRVVSRSQIQYFRSSRRFMRLVRFPGKLHKENLVRRYNLASFLCTPTVVTGAMATRSGSRRPRLRLRAHRRRLVPPEPHRRQRALPSRRRRLRGWPMTWAAPG